jgi:hypothetical protein
MHLDNLVYYTNGRNVQEEPLPPEALLVAPDPDPPLVTVAGKKREL